MTTSINKNIIGKGAAYIYIETIISMIFGYVFWIVMSKIGTVSVIGTSSAIISFAGIIAVVVSMGIPTGMQRFLGKSLAYNDSGDTRTILKASLFIITAGSIACSIVLFLFKDWIYAAIKVDVGLMNITILLIVSSVFTMLFRSVIISSLQTRSLPIVMSITSLLKLAVAAVLVLGGEGVFGLTVGFTINQVLSAILLAFVTVPYLKSTRHLKSKTSFKNALKNTLFASMVYWIPFLITTIGSQLGTVVVFGTNGSHQAGFFFIALTIVTGITGVVYSLFTIAFPALSAMHDGRKKFTWHTIRLSLIIALPFSTSLIFYSSDILHLLGKDYTEGSLSLQIMLLSIFPTTIQFGINSLVYSYGNYRQVLVIGIASSVSRALLYFILTPFYGGTGAAVGYTIGALLGLVASLLIAKRINMWLYWRKLGMIFAIPLIISIGLYYAKVNYILGICLELIITYIIMLKLDLLSRYDVYDIVKIFPHRISNRIIQVLSIIDRKSSGN